MVVHHLEGVVVVGDYRKRAVRLSSNGGLVATGRGVVAVGGAAALVASGLSSTVVVVVVVHDNVISMCFIPLRWAILSLVY